MAKRVRSARLIALFWLAALVPAAGATGSDGLRLLLLGMQDVNTPHTLLRADITVTVEAPPAAARTTDAIALFAPGKEARWYLQVREPALQSLVLGSERKVTVRSVGASTRTVPIGAAIDALGIAYEDLSRFILEDFAFWQITDESPTTILVGMHPRVESAYVYRAYSIDKDKKVPLRTQFYAKTLNNLVKLRVDAEHVLIGKKWFPGTIEFRNYPENVTTRLVLRWTQNASAPPELLAPASFAGAPVLAWPASDPGAGTGAEAVAASPTAAAVSPAAATRDPESTVTPSLDPTP